MYCYPNKDLSVEPTQLSLSLLKFLLNVVYNRHHLSNFHFSDVHMRIVYCFQTILSALERLHVAKRETRHISYDSKLRLFNQTTFRHFMVMRYSNKRAKACLHV